MKKIIILIVIVTIFVLPLSAQVDFSGSAEINFIANIPQDDYNSILNPQNMMKIHDLAMVSSLITKIDGGGEKSTFSAWFSLKEYPIGLGLLSATTGTVNEAYAYEFINGSGDIIFTPELMRLSANVFLGDMASLTIGRQSMLTGYGYGWNPIDFANPLKNPTDPNKELKGVDGLCLGIYPGNVISIRLYTLLPDNIMTTGLEYNEIKAGSELTLYFSGVEAKLAGFWDYDSKEGSDAYTPALGAAFMFDIFGAAVYSELSLRKGSRNYFPDESGNPLLLSRKTDWIFSGLGGIQYQFKYDINVVLEYFYNGEGFNSTERNNYKETLSKNSPTIDLIRLYTPGYFAQHYLLLNLVKSFYSANIDLNLSTIWSPDSQALEIMPLISYNFSGSIVFKLSYSGVFDLSNNDFNEVAALPVEHSLSLGVNYSF